ncbi:MAG: hypothetical protein ABI747_01085 [Candidatus Moraniibacteriota bacterium]
MPKKKRPIDTEIFMFAAKIVSVFIFVVVVALGIDLMHLIRTLSQTYGRSI